MGIGVSHCAMIKEETLGIVKIATTKAKG